MSDVRGNLSDIISQLQDKVRASNGEPGETIYPSNIRTSKSSNNVANEETSPAVEEVTVPSNVMKIKQRLSISSFADKKLVVYDDQDDWMTSQMKSPKKAVDMTKVWTKQDKAVEDLKNKLERKKFGQSSMKEEDESSSTIYEVNMRRAKFETLSQRNGTPETSRPRAASTAGTVLSNGDGIEEKTTMVVVQPKNSPSARISFSSIDTKRDIYMNQFDLQTRPVSEASPIKGDLENIINNSPYKRPENINGSKNVAPPRVAKTQTLPRNSKLFGSEEKDIVFKKPEDKVPISTATTPTTGNVVVPAKRTSLQGRRSLSKSSSSEEETFEAPARTTPKIEYKEVAQNQKSGPGLFTILEFKDSNTDYESLWKDVGKLGQ